DGAPYSVGGALAVPAGVHTEIHTLRIRIEHDKNRHSFGSRTRRDGRSSSIGGAPWRYRAYLRLSGLRIRQLWCDGRSVLPPTSTNGAAESGGVCRRRARVWQSHLLCSTGTLPARAGEGKGGRSQKLLWKDWRISLLSEKAHEARYRRYWKCRPRHRTRG